MHRFIIRLNLFLSPIYFLLILYFYFDPFKVLYHYETFYPIGKTRSVVLNYDYVAVETFKNNKKTYKYNSFIIGNSRSRFYEIEEWQKYIGSNECFHFDASNESLYGILKKLEFLEKHKVQLTNVLLIIDYGVLIQTENTEGHLFVKHTDLSGENKLGFQFTFFKSFLNLNFLRAYFDFKRTGKIKRYMERELLLDSTPTDYNVRTNEMKLNYFEKLIRMQPDSFYNAEKLSSFPKRSVIQTYFPPTIKEKQIEILKQINAIFFRNKSKYKIIISPLYDQVKLDSTDKNILDVLFGKENVYDFSGINKLTQDYLNYYENSHYRPHIASRIMGIIYTNDSLKNLNNFHN